uniref:P2X purinoreceptor 7 intracellular domain-containing protein n=1 Tax=Cyprinus carpio TaxID=7962 RepID=A0A8C1GBL2_CYPCA
MASNWDEEEVERPTVNIYDGPQPYNFEPFRRDRANEEIPRADVCVCVAVFGRCLCGRCRPMETVVESLCCREVSAFWSLVEDLTPRTHEYVHGLYRRKMTQYRYTAYRQAIRWAYGVLGRSIRKPLPSCVVSTIRQQFQSGDQTYQGFQWPRLDENE